MKSYSQIIFDFDGVILDSMSVRDKGFEIVLKAYPAEQVAQLMDYHRSNGGLSRYVKFRYFFEQVRGESITEEGVKELAQQFSEVMLRELTNKELLIEETVAFIQQAHAARIPMHIASGSDQTELRFLNQQLGIADRFVSIHGSPTPKNQLVKEILADNGYQAEETLLIGDSHNDFEAADINGVRFWGINNPKLEPMGEGYLHNSSYSPLKTF